jgi:flagellar basal body rod protein FlgG
MNYGFHLATAGAVTGMRRLDTIANNLANAQTVGFKADYLNLEARRAENLENNGLYADSNRALDALGGGTLFKPTGVDLRQGALRKTGRDLDIGLEGNGFIQLQNPKGSNSRDTMVTRAGELVRDTKGRLALAGSGALVQGTDGNPIQLAEDDPDLLIDSDGRVYQSGSEVGRIAIVMPSDLANLRKEGRDMMRVLGGKTTPAPEGTAVRQGSLEESTVDPVLALADLVKVSRGIEFSTRLMQYQDQMTGRLVETFGRFA